MQDDPSGQLIKRGTRDVATPPGSPDLPLALARHLFMTDWDFYGFDETRTEAFCGYRRALLHNLTDGSSTSRLRPCRSLWCMFCAPFRLTKIYRRAVWLFDQYEAIGVTVLPPEEKYRKNINAAVSRSRHPVGVLLIPVGTRSGPDKPTRTALHVYCTHPLRVDGATWKVATAGDAVEVLRRESLHVPGPVRLPTFSGVWRIDRQYEDGEADVIISLGIFGSEEAIAQVYDETSGECARSTGWAGSSRAGRRPHDVDPEVWLWCMRFAVAKVKAQRAKQTVPCPECWRHAQADPMFTWPCRIHPHVTDCLSPKCPYNLPAIQQGHFGDWGCLSNAAAVKQLSPEGRVTEGPDTGHTDPIQTYETAVPTVEAVT